jgi:enamine deaminase RidA (YjgF/YER057c/UK114 family)
VAGLLVHAVRDDIERPPVTLRQNDAACGRAWTTTDAHYATLQLQPAQTGEDRSQAEQARELLEGAEQVLRGLNMAFADVVRTWFYLDDILAGYDAFNAVRTEVYRGWGLMPRSGRDLILPASTGISCRSANGKVSLDLIARRPLSSAGAGLRQLSNAAQKDAFRYGSAFSRAASVAEDSGHLVELSGTASIDKSGESIHLGDVRAQAEATLDKILALVRPLGAELRDLASGTVFIKRPADYQAVLSVLAARGLAELPLVVVCADVCRHELLFELDGELLF